jgi:hypothetical protein
VAVAGAIPFSIRRSKGRYTPLVRPSHPSVGLSTCCTQALTPPTGADADADGFFSQAIGLACGTCFDILNGALPGDRSAPKKTRAC